jgi:hypothetical protein
MLDRRLEGHRELGPLSQPDGYARLPSFSRAGVTQLAECLLPKQNVAGSNPVSRSTSPFSLHC